MDTKTTHLIGGTIDGWNDCYEGCFAIERRVYNTDFDGFWADIIGDVPEGSVYFDGFLIVHNEADGIALMNYLEGEFAQARVAC